MNACAYPEVPNPWIVADTECENLWPGRFSMEASAVMRQGDVEATSRDRSFRGPWLRVADDPLEPWGRRFEG